MANDFIADLLGKWASEVNIASSALKLVVVVLLSTVLGCERARNRHAAGLRTFILVSLASSSAGITDLFLIQSSSASFPFLSAATVVGIAIISTNTILFSSKNQLKGLTTSVGLWTTAIIGIMFGIGLYTSALLTYFVFMLCLTFFTRLEKHTKKSSNHFEIHLELKARNLLQEFISTIRAFGMKIDDIEVNPAYANSGLAVYSVSVTILSDDLKLKSHSELVEALSGLECVSFIEEM